MSLAGYDPKTHSIFEAKYHVCTACVGENGLNDFQTYASGYFEAAKILLVQVIDGQNGLTQDTLVYPTLFNLRHGVELSIKHVAKVLLDAGLPPKRTPKINHELTQLTAHVVGGRHETKRALSSQHCFVLLPKTREH